MGPTAEALALATAAGPWPKSFYVSPPAVLACLIERFRPNKTKSIMNTASTRGVSQKSNN